MSTARPRLTERDMTLLSFLADHRLVLAAHVQTLLDVSATIAHRRLRALAEAGYVRRRTHFHHEPSCYQIERPGLAAIGSTSGPPRIDLNCYAHDIGVAWLWLAARAGRFGPMRAVLSERRLRCADAAPDRGGDWFGVRLGGCGPTGRPRLHYPDLLLVAAGDQRIAVELELSAKGRTRRDTILSGYAFDGRVSSVLYLVDRPSVGRVVVASAERLGLGDLVQVQRVRWSGAGRSIAAAEHGRRRARVAEERAL